MLVLHLAAENLHWILPPGRPCSPITHRSSVVLSPTYAANGTGVALVQVTAADKPVATGFERALGCAETLELGMTESGLLNCQSVCPEAGPLCGEDICKQKKSPFEAGSMQSWPLHDEQWIARKPNNKAWDILAPEAALSVDSCHGALIL